MRRVLIGLVAGFILSSGIAYATHQQEAGVPVCLEDERAWGVGDYQGSESGGWERWTCVHNDYLRNRFFKEAVRYTTINQQEWLHRRVMRRWICHRPVHWERYHGVDVMPEGCELG